MLKRETIFGRPVKKSFRLDLVSYVRKKNMEIVAVINFILDVSCLIVS